MVRTFDKKINCNCGGTYLMLNKYKHFATNKHKNFIAPKELSENASSRALPINQPVLEPIEEDEYEFDINDLIDYNEEESDIFWIINYPQDRELVNIEVGNYRSKYSRVGKSNKKKWVNNIFYNYIKSYEDIIHILVQT